MPRRVQDIIPSGKRSIRDITLEEGTREKTRSVQEKTTEIKIHKPKRDEPVGNVISFKQETPKKKRKDSSAKMLLVFVGTTLAILVVAYFASQFYAKASFSIVPKSYPVNVSKTVVSQSSQSSDAVTYTIKNLSESQSVIVASTEGPYSETKSTGKVVLYNNYSATAQRLIAGTRLAQANNGLVYKLSNSVTVPGKTSKGPGQVTVSIIADKAGDQYNIKKSSDITLRLLGFLGSPKYDGFYAKMSTDIAGGFAGKKKNISASDMSTSIKTLGEQLKATLTMKAKDVINNEEILFDEGILFSTSSVVVSENNSTSSKISMTGDVNLIVFNKKNLFSKIAGEEIIKKFGQYDFYVKGLDDMKVSFTNLKDFSVSKKNTLMTNFKGDIVIVAQIPIDEIKKKLIGLPLSKTYEVIRSYPDIIDTTSKGEVFPPWSKVPSSEDNIRITVENI